MQGTKIGMVQNHLQNTETLTESTASQWNSSGYFPGFNSLQLNDEVKCLLLRLGETPENFTGRIFSGLRSMIIPVDQETMKKNACQMPISLLYMQRDLEEDNGHSLALVPKKSCTRSMKTVHKEKGTVRRKRC